MPEQFIPNPKQHVFFTCPAIEKLYGGAGGGGKMAPLDSLVYTPFGPKLMADIKLGDQVSNPDGTVARVIGVYPQGQKEIYRVTFDDGASCEVGDEHLWLVREPGVRRYRKRPKDPNRPAWRVATTAQIRDDLDGGKRLIIPLTAPVQFTITSRYPDGRWPVDPYTLGVIIGDGHIRDTVVSITTADPEIIEHVTGNGYDYTSKHDTERTPTYDYTGDLPRQTGQLGLTGKRAWEKFIPQAYFVAPLPARWALLRGLMDTDGYADSRGHASYTTTSPYLAEDVQWIARSLGYKANITSKNTTYTYNGDTLDGRVAFTIWIKGNDHRPLFTLERKRERATAPYNGGSSDRGRQIISIEFSRHAQAQCIQVDHPNSLYLTDDFIVTHNTRADFELANMICSKYPTARVAIFRRTTDQLRFLKDKAEEFLGDTVRMNRNTGIIRYPNGSVIHLNHAHRPEDIKKALSEEYAYIIFDEASTFLLSQIDYARTRNRTPISGLIPRFILSTNPGGVGHMTLVEEFIDPRPESVAELLYYYPWGRAAQIWDEITTVYDLAHPEHYTAAKQEWLQAVQAAGITWHAYSEEERHERKSVEPGLKKWDEAERFDVWRPYASETMKMLGIDDSYVRTRAFIPAYLQDNPALPYDQYAANLATIKDQKIVNALLMGDWTTFEGQFFHEFETARHGQPWHVIPPLAPEPHWPVWASMDWGYSAMLVVLWHAYNPLTGQIVTFDEMTVNFTEDRSVAQRIIQRSQARQISAVFADPAMWKDGGGNIGQKTRGERYAEWGVPMTPANNDRITGWSAVRTAMATNPATGEPGWVITSNCRYTIETLPKLVYSETKPEDLDEDGEDHAADCLRYGIVARPNQSIAASINTPPNLGSFSSRHGRKPANSEVTIKLS